MLRRPAACPRAGGYTPRRASSTLPAQGRSAPVARKRANIGGVQLDGSTKRCDLALRCASPAHRPPRWYKKTQVAPTTDGAWEVLLDDRSINTPKNNDLRVPTEALAHAIAQVRCVVAQCSF